ncbi:MAG: hypothetical protein WCK09_03375 [Bacteroidota bacterium]
MKASIEYLNPFEEQDDMLWKAIEILSKGKEVEVFNSNTLRKEIEALRKEIDEIRKKSFRKKVGRLLKENEDYNLKDKLSLNMVSPLIELGIQENGLSEVLKPVFDIHVPSLKTFLEEDQEKHQEAAFRSRGGGASSAIGVR